MTPKFDRQIRKAILEKRLIHLVYKGKQRIIEPHDYGVRDGAVILLGYQMGVASSGAAHNWRYMNTALISDLRLLRSALPLRRRLLAALRRRIALIRGIELSPRNEIGGRKRTSISQK